MKRSKFSLSHYKLLTCDMGQLIPIGLTEVLPGDTMQQASSLLVRVSPLLAPVMHPVHVRIHHWFVPHRLVWEDFEQFITGGPDGADDSEVPHAIDTTAANALSDYLGIPILAVAQRFNVLAHRGYNLIWNEFYRDQDLLTEVPISKASGLDTTITDAVLPVCWEKDYFTSARPWTQKGPDVTVPFATSAPVVTNNQAIRMRVAGTGVPRDLRNEPDTDLGSGAYLGLASELTSGTVVFDSPTGLEADLTGASAVNINALREAFALQRYAEARARYGSRYTEYLRYLGVRSSDARLQRPEYLGGGKQTIQFSEVLQTGPDSGDEGVASLKGHGIGAVRSNRYRRYFEEHGYVFSLLSVKPKTMYAQGIPRHFTRQTKEDFFQRELQHIGQQEVYNREVYAAHTTPDGIFGYQDRYDEYRRTESSVAGDFRDTLDYWHYARIFASDVTLNGAFVSCDATKRPNAVQTEHVLWIMANHSIQARRMVAGTGSSFIF